MGDDTAYQQRWGSVSHKHSKMGTKSGATAAPEANGRHAQAVRMHVHMSNTMLHTGVVHMQRVTTCPLTNVCRAFNIGARSCYHSKCVRCGPSSQVIPAV